MSKLQPKQKAPEFHVCDTSGAVKFVIKPNDAGAICFYPVSGGVMSGTASLVLPSTGLTAADVGAIAKGVCSDGAALVWDGTNSVAKTASSVPSAISTNRIYAYNSNYSPPSLPNGTIYMHGDVLRVLNVSGNTKSFFPTDRAPVVPTSSGKVAAPEYGIIGTSYSNFLHGAYLSENPGNYNGSLNLYDDEGEGVAIIKSEGGVPKYTSPLGDEYDIVNVPSLGSKTIFGTASTSFTDYLGSTISVDSYGWSSNTTSGFYYRTYGGGASTAASFGVGSISVTDQYQDSGIIHITEPGYYLVWGSIGIWNATGSTVNSISHVIEFYSYTQFNSQDAAITRVGRTVNSIAHNAGAGVILHITPQMIKWDGSDPNGAFVTHAIHKSTTANIKYQNPFLAITKLASL